MNDSTQINSCDVLQIFIGLATLIVTYLTFRLARKVHKEFSKNHANSKQVEKMSDLVEFLNNTRIYLNFIDYYPNSGAGGTSYGIDYNIFEIGDLLENKTMHNVIQRTIDFNDYDDCQVLLGAESEQIMDINKFVDNPFIPKQIADRLFSFFVIQSEIIKSRDLGENKTSAVVLYTTEKIYNGKNLKQADCEALRSWLNLKTYSHDLTKAISEWFLEKGVGDYNVRIDYKNIRK
jgi:hypothetical protein